MVHKASGQQKYNNKNNNNNDRSEFRDKKTYKYILSVCKNCLI